MKKNYFVYSTTALLIFISLFCLSSKKLAAQDEVPQTSYQDTTTEIIDFLQDSTYQNQIAGEFTPAKGFDVVKTSFGSLNISGYGLARYLNQLPWEQTYTDHLGNQRTLHYRNDVYFQRFFMWLTGFLGTQRFRYNLTVWGLVPTQQTLVFGNLTYAFGRAFRLGVGIGPNLGIRSVQGPWPFFNASDRQMGDESLRPGFTGSFWATGELVPRFYYTAAIGNNLSILGVTASQLTRNLTTSMSFWWMPTTGEFGPRGGNNDLENHTKLATRFGLSFGHARDARFSSLSDSTSNNTQVKLSDGVNVYERGALANGVTVSRLDWDMGSVDIGFKYRGFFFMAQYYVRNLSKFAATGPLPMSSIFDQTIQLDASYMLLPYTLCSYLSGSYMLDDFERYPNEISTGLNYYPLKNRSLRFNLHYIYIVKSPTGSSFGYYVQGQTGTTISLGVDILL